MVTEGSLNKAPVFKISKFIDKMHRLSEGKLFHQSLPRAAISSSHLLKVRFI